MTKQEFFSNDNEYPTNTEIKIRYFTYNRNEYIDILGKFLTKRILRHDNYAGFFAIEFIEICNIHGNFKEKNIPNLQYHKINDKLYCDIKYQNIIFIKPTSIRAYKINKINEKIKNRA